MKRLINTILFFTVICCSQNSDYNQKVENLKTFAKVYGYVKYFHPSDEAAEIDWSAFAIYGAKEVEKCRTKEDLLTTMQTLFEPIAPSIILTSNSELPKLNTKSITPNNSKGYLSTYWQHSGLEVGMNPGYRAPYHSSRVNGVIKKDYSKVVSKIVISINTSKYKNKKIKLNAFAKIGDGKEVKSYLRLVLENSDGTSDLKRAEITGMEWKKYEIIENLDSLTTSIGIGSAMKGKGSLLLDNVKVFYQENEHWIEIKVPNNSFEDDVLVEKKHQNKWYHEGVGYFSEVISSDSYDGERAAQMKYTGVISVEKGPQLYDYKPEFGELISKDVGNNVYCQIPIVLFSDDTGTFPNADINKFNKLIHDLDQLETSPNNESVRIGNVINTYSVFQHFYPYMKDISINWDSEFEKAISRSFTDVSGRDHLITLQKFTSPLKDGHISVTHNKNRDFLTPPITWEWVEDKLVITNVLEDETQLEVGDIITEIEGQSTAKFFEEINSRISAGTVGWLNHKAEQLSLIGEKDSEITLATNQKTVKLLRNTYPYGSPGRQSNFEKVNDSVYYLNINKISIDEINQLLPELEKSKSIICDLRVYPNRNHGLISHLLSENDTTSSWMQIPHIVYPDGNLVGSLKSNWMLPSKKPFLGDKQIIFITKGSAISYAESYMGFIHGYKLATIVGQPTAGTNGNINRFELPGGYGITWTGMKVVKHDGTQLHAIGFIPDIYMNKTIKGVKEGRDEFLEKAIELTRQEN